MTIQNIATKKIIQNYPKAQYDSMDKKTKALYKVLQAEDEKEIPVKDSKENTQNTNETNN